MTQQYFEVTVTCRDEEEGLEAAALAKVPVFEPGVVPVALMIPNASGSYQSEPGEYLEILSVEDRLYVPKRHLVKSQKTYIDVAAGSRHFSAKVTVEFDGWTGNSVEEEASRVANWLASHIIIDGHVYRPAEEPIFRVEMYELLGRCHHNIVRVVEKDWKHTNSAWFSMNDFGRAKAYALSLAERARCTECTESIGAMTEPQIFLPDACKSESFAERQTEMAHNVRHWTTNLVRNLRGEVTLEGLDSVISAAKHISAKMDQYDLDSVVRKG